MFQFDGIFFIDPLLFSSRLQHPRNIWLVSRWRRVTSYGSILPRREVLGARLSRRNPLHLSSLKWIQKIPSHGPLSCKLLLFFKKRFFFFCIIFHNGIVSFMKPHLNLFYTTISLDFFYVWLKNKELQSNHRIANRSLFPTSM